MPEEASTYALPARWRDEWGIRRYGFHGLSVQWAAEQVRAERLVVCHLGGGCSVSAVRGAVGRHDDGLQPARGRADGDALRARSTRRSCCISCDGKLGVEEIERALESESGLLGLSGERAGRRADTLDGAGGEARARRVRASGRGGRRVDGGRARRIDALVFTAGIGEGSAGVRADVCGRLGFLGVELDQAANEARFPTSTSALQVPAVRVVVLHAREDVVAARAARALLA